MQSGRTDAEKLAPEAAFRPRGLLARFRAAFRWDKALAVAEAIEDEESSRRLTLRK